MQFMALFAINPGRAQVPVPAELRQAEFETVRGFYMESFVRRIWARTDVRGACILVEAGSMDEVSEKLGMLPLVRAGFLQPPTIIPLQPYAGFAPNS
jgi:hypothetical protein